MDRLDLMVPPALMDRLVRLDLWDRRDPRGRPVPEDRLALGDRRVRLVHLVLRGL